MFRNYLKAPPSNFEPLKKYGIEKNRGEMKLRLVIHVPYMCSPPVGRLFLFID